MQQQQYRKQKGRVGPQLLTFGKHHSRSYSADEKFFKSQGKNFQWYPFLAVFRVSLKVAPMLVELSEKTHRLGRQAYRGQLGAQR